MLPGAHDSGMHLHYTTQHQVCHDAQSNFGRLPLLKHDVVCGCQGVSPSGSNPVRDYLDSHKPARVGLYGAAVFLAGTLLFAAFRVFQKYNTPQKKRKRNVHKTNASTAWLLFAFFIQKNVLSRLGRRPPQCSALQSCHPTHWCDSWESLWMTLKSQPQLCCCCSS